MNSNEIRKRFLHFFEKRGHVIIPSSSLVTPDEKGVTNSTLFNTAGMQPLVPYLLGKIHPRGTRLADVQKCLRTNDIDEIGDKTHDTFFEMLGNWSLGDYFKKDAINWSYEFLTSKDEGLGLDPKRLYVTVFEGDANAPRDDEAAIIWSDVFKKNIGIDLNISPDGAKNPSRIFFMPASSNWWEAGENGPCGPDSEMYYDVLNTYGGKEITKAQFLEADEKRHIVEVWNDVFMQYEKKDGKIIGKLPKPSVDTGAGLERVAMMVQSVDNIYDTDLLKPVFQKVRELAANWDIRSARIVADHVRASAMLINDGVIPSNTGRGYILRRLLRRAISHAHRLKMTAHDSKTVLKTLIPSVVEIYNEQYPELTQGLNKICTEIDQEENKFMMTLDRGLKEFEKGVDAFTLFSSYGFPLELSLELAKEKGISIDVNDFEQKFKAHQELSRVGAEQKFKGGLADANDPMIVRYHTATHLLHQALHDVLGERVMQKGSNITIERLRFDFAHGAKMTEEEKKQVEAIVNEKIQAALPVNKLVMNKEDAEKTGARHFFGEKYGDEISVYFIGSVSNPPSVNDLNTAYSKEFCGGPHVTNTNELAGPDHKCHFRIQKEEAVAQGIRRIKAVLE